MNHRNIRKATSIIGLLVTISFFISFAILISIHPVSLEVLADLSFFGYNIEGIESQKLIAYFNYLTIGVLIILFSIGLIALLPNSYTNIFGSLFLILMGLIWSSLAFFSINPEDDGLPDYIILTIFLILMFSILAQLFLCNDLHKIIKTLLFSGAIFVMIEFMLCIFIPDFFITIPLFSIVFLISNIGVIGYNLSKDL